MSLSNSSAVNEDSISQFDNSNGTELEDQPQQHEAQPP